MLPLIEMLPPEQIEQVPDGVFVAHLLPRHIPKNVFEKRCKIVNIYRNPKAVVVPFKFIKTTTTTTTTKKQLKEGELMKDMEYDQF